MSENYKDKKFQKLLEKLQQESWQLELIISGFAIFGLFTAFPHIKTAFQVAEYDKQIHQFIVYTLLLISCSILLFNLLIHVILRGLWIGALGLRYVSGDIDFERLKYHRKFNNYLKKKIVSFDKFVATLENYCSVLFAISFLLIFYVISCFLIIFSIVGVATYIISNDNLPDTLRTIVGVFLIVFICIGSILVFIDFITQGFLKKKKWLAKIYFPFYWVFSFITLSFLYRPLVYNFLDNKFGKRLSFVLVPVYLIIVGVTSLKYQKSNYLQFDKISSSIKINKRNYEDLLKKDTDFIRVAAIQSKVITAPYIKVFRVYSESLENQIFSYHPSIKPKEDVRGLKSDIIFFNNSNSRKKRDSLTRKYIEVFNEMHQVYIDSTFYKTTFIVSKSSKNKLGFEAYISTKNLTQGKHLLKLIRYKKRKKDTVKLIDVTIPFWYFKD
ncbi:MAG: hypothetical protein HWD85_00330 [Flavobacteriaceae bacterium]|nr:hypothetical protein [Flavobacteriaceae bacterium]